MCLVELQDHKHKMIKMKYMILFIRFRIKVLDLFIISLSLIQNWQNSNKVIANLTFFLIEKRVSIMIF